MGLGGGAGGAGLGGADGWQPSQTVNETADRCREGGQGEGRGKLSRGLGILGDAPIAPQEAEQDERKLRLVG